MTMTPAEIENKRFRRRFRGFDREEVLHYLGEVSEEMLALASRIEELGRQSAELERRMAEYRRREGTIQETLFSVQKLAEEIKQGARHEAELIVREARLAGETVIRQAREEVIRLEEEIVHLRVERDNFEDRVRLAAEEHLRVLDGRREEGEVREKLRVLSLRHGANSPPLPFSEALGETLGGLPQGPHPGESDSAPPPVDPPRGLDTN